MDGLSLLLIVLSNFLGLMAVIVSWRGIQEKIGFFHANLLWEVAALCGVFLALDLFLFYVFWEVLLIPLYFLISIWGHERRAYAAIKFFIYAQAGGLFLLLSILGLYFIHAQTTGEYTFNYFQLLNTEMSSAASTWLMLGFVLAFLVKLPGIPLHSWLPEAHVQAPAAGSVDLAGLVLKVGGYGLIRFAVPLFPDAFARWATAGALLGAAGILYGAVTAFSQTDLKRFVAYSSVSHMGFVLLAICAWNSLSLQGAVIVMLSQGISTGALFMVCGAIYERLRTRDMNVMGGLWNAAPRMGGMMLFFALASLGLPGLGNFVGEFLVLLGSFQRWIGLTAIAAIGLIVSVVYSLWLVQRVFQGPRVERGKCYDLRWREVAALAAMAVILVWIGLAPRPIIRMAEPSLRELLTKSDLASSQSHSHYVKRTTANQEVFHEPE
jgi:NADH-quinone oxidoreductase subunit M